MIYTHQPQDIPSQVQLLRARGLHIPDTEQAENCLQSISLFRLSSYLRYFETDEEHLYAQGTTLPQVLQLYVFDNEIRSLIFKGIQEIEIALRAKIIQAFSLQYGAFWFSDPALFRNSIIHNDCLTSLKKELHRSNEDFIGEYYRRYTSPDFPPVWKSLEVTSFGTLSKLYGNFSDSQLKNQVARAFGLPHYKFLESWITCIVVLRNACAHHARVWNRRFAVKPTMPSSLAKKWITPYPYKPIKLYPQLCCIAYLCQSITPTSHFVASIKKLLDTFPLSDYHAMGFPKNWHTDPLWN